MTWARPELLALLAALALLGALRWWWAARLRRQRAGVGAGHPQHAHGVGRRREVLRAALLWSGAALAAVALAGPRWGASEEKRSATGADLLILLDCSRSMLAADLYPNRLEVARRKAGDLLARAPELRAALMPFAAVPALRCPLTGDHDALRAMLADCSPDLFPAEHGYQGTAIGLSLVEGLKVLGRQVERGQAVLVLSDGADEDRAAVERGLAAAKAAGVPVFGLFLGDAEREVKLAIDGRDEVMGSSRATLDDLAKGSGGIAVNATADDRDVVALHQGIRGVVALRPWEERRRIVASERFQWFLLPALALLAAGLLLPTRRRVP